MKRLAGKVAVITGSSAGIGRACAELFAEEGAKVIVSDHGADPRAGAAVVEGIAGRGGEAWYYKADVGKSDEVAGLMRTVLQRHGRIDVLMNNAVSGKSGSILDLQPDDWDSMYTATVKAVAVACKEVIPGMRRQGGGSIINTASIHGLAGARGSAPYNTFKAALINLTRQIAVEYGRDNIRCNALCPGRILTEWKNQWLIQNPREVVRQKYVYPLGRPGLPREAAMAALFLACEESSFVTGHALVVDGGLMAQLPDYAANALDDGLVEEAADKGNDKTH